MRNWHWDLYTSVRYTRGWTNASITYFALWEGTKWSCMLTLAFDKSSYGRGSDRLFLGPGVPGSGDGGSDGLGCEEADEERPLHT